MLKGRGFITVKAAAELLGVSPNTVRAWGEAGKITEFRHPVNNYRLYPEKDLRAINRKLQTARPRTAAARPSRQG